MKTQVNLLLITVSLGFGGLSSQATPVLNPANGHYYEYVYRLDGLFLPEELEVAGLPDASEVPPPPDSSIPLPIWEEANILAGFLEHNGAVGHLATITSQEENDFIRDFVISGTPIDPTRHSAWIGASQAEGSPEPGGGWMWVTGEPFVFTNWDSGEPNDSPTVSGDNEESLQIFTDHPFNSSQPGSWNDAPGMEDSVNPFRQGFVVEYDPLSTPVPEPAEIALLIVSCGGVGLAWRRRRGR